MSFIRSKFIWVTNEGLIISVTSILVIPQKLNSKEKELLKQLADMPNIKESSKAEEKSFFKRFGL